MVITHTPIPAKSSGAAEIGGARARIDLLMTTESRLTATGSCFNSTSPTPTIIFVNQSTISWRAVLGRRSGRACCTGPGPFERGDDRPWVEERGPCGTAMAAGPLARPSEYQRETLQKWRTKKRPSCHNRMITEPQPTVLTVEATMKNAAGRFTAKKKPATNPMSTRGSRSTWLASSSERIHELNMNSGVNAPCSASPEVDSRAASWSRSARRIANYA